MYFNRQVAMRPDGWAYIRGGQSFPRCTVKPIAVKEGDVHVR